MSVNNKNKKMNKINAVNSLKRGFTSFLQKRFESLKSLDRRECRFQCSDKINHKYSVRLLKHPLRFLLILILISSKTNRLHVYTMEHTLSIESSSF